MRGANGGTADWKRREAESNVLHRRLLSSAVVLALICSLIWAEYQLGERTGRLGILVVAVVGIVLLWSGEELRRMITPHVPLPAMLLWSTLALSGGVSVAPLLWVDYPVPCGIGRLGWLGLGYALALGIPFLVAIARYRPANRSLEQVIYVFFVCGYVLLLTFICQLRFSLPNLWGIVAMLSLLVPVKMSDSFAYLIGRVWGRRKMSPQLSPGKTVEGGLAALAFGSLGALLVLFPLAYALTGQFAVRQWWVAVVFGVAVTIAGICGDLAESLIKRELGHKDSGGLIPGMGGILDVIDSVLVAAPVVYAFWISGLVGPLAPL